jgi:hypothetical protein
MPRVPTYDTQPLQPTIRQGEARAPLTMEQAAMPGRQIQEAGEAMGRIGSALGQYVLQRQNELNDTLADDAVNTAERQLNEELTSYQQRQGLNAINDPQAFNGGDPIAYFQERRDRILGEITANMSPAVRQRAQNSLFRLGTRFDGSVTSHFTEETQRYNEDTDRVTIAQAQQAIVQDPSDDNLEYNSGRINATVARQWARAGRNPDLLPSAQQEAVSQALGSAITSMLQSNNPRGAQDFLNRHGEAMLPTERTEIGEQVRNAMATVLGRENAQEAMALPEGRRSAFLQDQARTESGEIDENQLRVSRSILNTLESEERQRIAVAEAARIRNLLSLGPSVINSPLFLTLNDDDRNTVLRNIEAGPNPTAENQRAWFNLAQDETLYSNNLQSVRSEEQLEATYLLPLGRFYYNTLLDDWRELQPQLATRRAAEAALGSPTISGGRRTALQEAAALLDLPSDGEDFVGIFPRAQALLADAQVRGGRELTHPEMVDLFVVELARQVPRRGGAGSANTVRVGEITYNQIPDVEKVRIERVLGRLHQQALSQNAVGAYLFDPSIQENVVLAYIEEQRTGQRLR